MHCVGSDPLVEFRFSSRIADDLPPEAMLRLVRQAWSDNLRLDVSGFLRVDGMSVDQCIEGRSATILALAARILTDPRHREIVVRSLAPIAERSCAAWTVEGLEPPARPRPRRASTPDALRLLICADIAPASGPAASPALARQLAGRPAP